MTEREASGRTTDDQAARDGHVEGAAADHGSVEQAAAAPGAAEGGETADLEPRLEPETEPPPEPDPDLEPNLEPHLEPAGEPEPEPDLEPHLEPAGEPEPDAEPDPEPDLDGSRPAGIRLAGIHLRTGLHALARAELEAFAGRGLLDESALLDLAEVRWRTGDLAGAGDAANKVLARGSEAPLALVIAAEAVAALGRPGEARRLAARLAELRAGERATIFAGMPMAPIWPDEGAATEPEASGRAALAGTARPALHRRGHGPGAPDEPVAAPAAAAEALAGGRAALAAGDHARAALMLGVALRLEPGFAPAVLGAVSGRDENPLLALVEGDALRLLGREAEALAAFDQARGHRKDAAGRTRAFARQASPGLFDDVPDPADGAAD